MPDATGMVDAELFEELGVEDLEFHVTKSIDQCPPGCQGRELLANAIEAEMLEEEHGIRRIVLSAVHISGAPVRRYSTQAEE